MSEITSTIPSAPEPAPEAPQVPAAPRNRGIGIAALIVGLAAVVCAIIPGLSFVAFIPAGIAMILGIIGLATRSSAFGQSLAGLILGSVAIIIAIIVSIAFIASTVTPDVSVAPPAAGGNSEQTADPEAETPAAEVGTRENPAPFGSTVVISDNSGPIWNITLGAANLNAGDAIAAENQFNPAADAGFQYVLVPVTYTYVGTTTGTPWIDTTIVFVAAAGTTHDQQFVVAPSPITDIGELYPGASATGNLVVMAPTADIEKGTWAIGSLFGDKFFIAVQ